MKRLAVSRERPDSTGPPNVEYGTAAFLLKRLVRPTTYSRALQALRDRPHWREIDRRVSERIHEVGPDFSLVQIGANDGLRNDPVHRLIAAHDLTALLVEPVPRYYDQLQQTYRGKPHVQFAQVAVSRADGIATLNAILPEDGGSSRMQGCSSFDLEVMRDAAWVVKDAASLRRQIEVPTMRLGTLLDAYNVPSIDYLVVDTEGHDKIVLDQLQELSPNRHPDFILYENIHLRQPDRTELETWLQANDYTLTHMRRDTFAQMLGPHL